MERFKQTGFDEGADEFLREEIPRDRAELDALVQNLEGRIGNEPGVDNDYQKLTTILAHFDTPDRLLTAREGIDLTGIRKKYLQK